MPGIVGFFLSSDDIDRFKLLDSMVLSVYHRSDYVLFKYSPEGSPFSCALIVLKELVLKNCLIVDSFNEYVLVFNGELYNNYTSFSDSRYILELFGHNRNFDFLVDLEGVFSFVLYDIKEQKLYLVSDKFGLKPIYYVNTKDGLLFASEIKALLVYPNVSKKVDFDALSSLFYFGFLLGNNTLFRNVKLLSQSTVLTYNLKDKKIFIRKYWNSLNLFTPKREYEDIQDGEIIYLFFDAVKKRLKNKEYLGISLSGGLDSRTILAALRKEARGMPSYTLGLKGCQDEIFSAQLAQIAGTNHVFVPITENILRDFISLVRSLIFYSDGLYHSCELTEKVALDYFKEAPFKILLRGHGGEIAKASLIYPIPADYRVSKIKTFSDFIEFILDRGSLIPKEDYIDKVFSPYLSSQMKGRVLSYIENAFFDAYSVLSVVDLLIYFFIFEYLRRYAVASLDIFRTQVEVRLPFMDEKFLAKVLKLPIKRRYNGEIHYKIIKHAMPALVKVPNSNTGAPLDAGKLRLWFTDKLNSLLKKLSVPGFRHYTEFEKWQRKYFREAIENILFDPRTLERGLYRKKGLEEVFKAHISGKKNYARLLGIIVGLELWFREFVD